MESDNAILFEMIPKPHNHHPKSTNKSHSITSLNLKTRSITTSTIMEHSSSVSATPEAEQAVEFSTEDDDASTDSTGSDSMGIGSMESTFMTDPNDIQQSTTVDKIPTSSVTQSVTSITSPLDSSLSQTTSTALLTISSTSDDSEVSDPPEVYDDENSTLVSPESSGHMPESFVTKTPQANLSVGDIGNITSTTSSHDDDYEDFKKPSMGNFSSDGELKTQTNDTNKFGDLPFHSTAIVTGSQPVNSVLTFGTINVSQRTSTSPPDPEDKSSSTSSGAEGSFSTTLRRKRDPIFHSTQATPRPRPKNNSRVRRNLDLFNFLLPSGDIADELDLTGEDWSKSETLFSQSLSAHPICSLCIWIQPNFASSFGAKSGLLHGISEVVQIVRLTDWLLRSQDFNEDGLPDNIGLKIKTIFTSDTIHLKPTQAEKDDAKSGPLYPLMRSTHRKNKRSLKDSAAFDPSNYDHNLAFESVDTDYPTHILDNPNDAMKLGIPIPRKPTSMEDAPLEEIPFSKMIYSVTAKETFARIAPQMRAQEELTGCCARLAFIYHNISPSLSISTKNGGCDRINNLILISGLYGTSKVGTWDIVRHLLHSIGHILGADHENLVDGKCGLHHVDTQETERAFLDPPVMDPRPYLNMGLRPASHRFSACARHGMALFLTSQNAHCLKGAHDEAVCGNGLVEGDEVCDCGSPSTCLLSGGCCGESVFSCAKVDCSAGQ
ncbi:uncharacterized protein LOC118434158 [Folsomia candida]|uniref:uncharacterized protein LOC118434158 n=1 Tax=Folsomia candida TaxID=158441 RepID=UPI001604AE24|nr:uncharacterized protein LOC118434158 [Folsomia candida]